MALIHQKLYMDENLASVNIENYVNQLANSLATSFGFDNSVVKTNINLNPKELDIDIAIPIGLIINELLTNSFKYAFTQLEEALVTITLKKDDNGKIDLNITDNGKGFNENNKKQENFGLKLVSTLVEQLNGNLTLANKNGTTYQIILNPTI
jgi:two-component sensor histidine kinase